MKPTADELLAELNRLAVARDADGISSSELGERWKVGETVTRKRIRQLFQSGKMEYAGTRRIPRIDGRMTEIPVYRIKDNPTAATSGRMRRR